MGGGGGGSHIFTCLLIALPLYINFYLTPCLDKNIYPNTHYMEFKIASCHYSLTVSISIPEGAAASVEYTRA